MKRSKKDVHTLEMANREVDRRYGKKSVFFTYPIFWFVVTIQQFQDRIEKQQYTTAVGRESGCSLDYSFFFAVSGVCLLGIVITCSILGINR